MQYIIHSHLESSPELIAQITQDFGLDKPLLTQYFAWLSNAIKLDFGTSYISGDSVSDDFFYYLPNTLKLAAFAFILMLLFSIPMGLISFIYRDRAPDFFIRFICFLGVSTPSFWLAFLLIMLFSIHLEWLPAQGLDSIQSYILPAFSIAFMSACVNARIIRTNMIENANERHILYAQARGISSPKIVLKHIFYNSLLPVVTAFGMHFGEILGWALVIENIFVLPGIGLYSIQGFLNHDFPIIQCFIVVMCLIFTLGNLAVDILYAFLDSRILRDINSV
ncbi:ABC transporter permease subunit [Helicobacter saguini]|uniref:ABC transporter permease subunit n=2 Tax=Helicobacter saguini TaxID=1548018 RepID=A0A347VML6_9HELI|nr:ABC transporter permease subunit [Helicobacter saguini]MWV68113.1 ABC transporter permease subunit [Helicobacter saguini]MWV70423.1 ABC transporter permease subunit [Helicobacter saguini]MWV72324.1 ABC transporter permease subunit [Helicobacter saguini]TLD93015.1 ABC transporter permease subunit [Helicobacter saguini]